MFADDKTLYASARTQRESSAILSAALRALNEALELLGMKINLEKTVVMSLQPKTRSVLPLATPLAVTLCGVTLREVHSVRCLGIVIDDQLSFSTHIDSVTAKVSRKIGVLRRTHRQLSLYAKRLYVLCVIQPDIEYALPVFLTYLSCRDRDRLFSLHRRALRAACGAPFDAPVKPLLHSLTLKPMDHRFLFLFCSFIFQCYIMHTSSALRTLFPVCAGTRATRGVTSQNIDIQRYRSMLGYNSFGNRSAIIWNAFPTAAKSCKNIIDFKRELLVVLSDNDQFLRLRALLFDNVFNL